MARDLDRELLDWGRRPSRTPPEVAAAQVTARLLPHPRWQIRHRFAAALVVLVVSIGIGLLALREERTDIAMLDFPPLDDNVVLWWVDPETPVYFVLSPPDSE